VRSSNGQPLVLAMPVSVTDTQTEGTD